MGKITGVFIEENPEDINFQLINRSPTNTNRPAWLQINSVNAKIGFTCYEGDDGTRTYYKKIFKNFYIPLDVTSEEIILFYDAIAPNYDSLNQDNFEIAKFVLGKLVRYDLKAPRVLDLLGGTGIIAAELASAFKNIDILDGSAKMLLVAKRKSALHDSNLFSAI